MLAYPPWPTGELEQLKSSRCCDWKPLRCPVRRCSQHREAIYPSHSDHPGPTRASRTLDLRGVLPGLDRWNVHGLRYLWMGIILRGGRRSIWYTWELGRGRMLNGSLDFQWVRSREDNRRGPWKIARHWHFRTFASTHRRIRTLGWFVETHGFHAKW